MQTNGILCVFQRKAMLQKIGHNFIKTIRTLLYSFGFFFSIIRETVLFWRNRSIAKRVLTMQILFTGVDALSIVSILSMSLGAVIIIQGISIFSAFGQGNLIYSVLITVITRELGPILTAFIIIARSGTAIATELGTMVVNHEIEAYISTGINPVSFLAVPRFLGVTIALVVLNVYFNIFGLFGSYLISQLVSPIPFFEYFSKLLAQLKFIDIVSSLIKSLSFGIIISSIATYHGFQVEKSSTEIPQVAIKAVSQGFTMCIVANAVLTLIYYI